MTGFPLVLNGTNEIFHGEGLNALDYVKVSVTFERTANFCKKYDKQIRHIYRTIFGKVTDD